MGFERIRGIIVHNTSCPKRARESLQILPAAVELCPNHSHRLPCTGLQLLRPYALQQERKTVLWGACPVEIKQRVKDRQYNFVRPSGGTATATVTVAATALIWLKSTLVCAH